MIIEKINISDLTHSGEVGIKDYSLKFVINYSEIRFMSILFSFIKTVQSNQWSIGYDEFFDKLSSAYIKWEIFLEN